MVATLYYIHDPMCSWCWGFRPILDKLKMILTDDIHIEYVVGGLAKDTQNPMPKAQQLAIQNHWHEIQRQLGTPFNFDFWTNNQPRRATFMACRAVVAAKELGFEEAMINAIQHAYYLEASNPSDTEVLVNLADELIKKNLQTSINFAEALQSPSVKNEFDRQLQLARSLPINGFPSLVLKYQNNYTLLPQTYTDSQLLLTHINHIIAAD